MKKRLEIVSYDMTPFYTAVLTNASKVYVLSGQRLAPVLYDGMRKLNYWMRRCGGSFVFLIGGHLGGWS